MCNPEWRLSLPVPGKPYLFDPMPAVRTRSDTVVELILSLATPHRDLEWRRIIAKPIFENWA
jgi:hypothetical protein